MCLKQFPKIQDKGPLAKLCLVVDQYIQEMAHNAPFAVHCILMEWPWFVVSLSYYYLFLTNA